MSNAFLLFVVLAASILCCQAAVLPSSLAFDDFSKFDVAAETSGRAKEDFSSGSDVVKVFNIIKESIGNLERFEEVASSPEAEMPDASAEPMMPGMSRMTAFDPMESPEEVEPTNEAELETVARMGELTGTEEDMAFESSEPDPSPVAQTDETPMESFEVDSFAQELDFAGTTRMEVEPTSSPELIEPSAEPESPFA